MRFRLIPVVITQGSEEWNAREQRLIRIEKLRRPVGIVFACVSDAEQKIFDALPDRVRVFRGCSRAYIKGVSWTTKRHIAEWFAEWRCFDPDPVVVTGMIDKRNIFATNNDRNEHEVILDPHQVQELSIETWVPKAA